MAYKDPLDERARASRRRHYDNNKEAYKTRARQTTRDMREWLDSLKGSTPCMDCEVQYPACVMDFDHRDPSQKIGNVTTMATKGNWNALRKEVAKCDIVCANCHRLRTWKPNS